MLSKLLAFKEVAERRSFRAAAESIHISGPALTLRIQALEAELGFKLLIRDKGGVRLTAEGERFLPYARSSIQAFRDGVCEAHKAKSYATSYRVIGSLNFMHSFFPSWLRLLRQERPDMSLLVECGYPDLAVRLFSARLLDLAFSYEQLDLAGLTSSVLFTEKILMVTSCALYTTVSDSSYFLWHFKHFSV